MEHKFTTAEAIHDLQYVIEAWDEDYGGFHPLVLDYLLENLIKEQEEKK